MSDNSSRTRVTSVLFLDIAGYSAQPVARQLALKQAFNEALARVLSPIATADRVILDTGDGAAVTFLATPEDALFAGLLMQRTTSELPLRLGINLGPVRIVRDLNGQTNVIGDGINVGQRVMSFAEPGQLLVSRSFHEVVSRVSSDYERLFCRIGERQDKHERPHELYAVELSGDALPGFLAANCGESWLAAAGLLGTVGATEEALAPGPAQVFNAGEHYIVSGPSRAAVQAALDRLAQSGSRVLSPISLVGKKWIATCEQPSRSADCRVEELGRTRIITGASAEAVGSKLEELIAGGARLVHDVENTSGVWTAVCEVSTPV
jgi:class 3 adenylate cyclase